MAHVKGLDILELEERASRLRLTCRRCDERAAIPRRDCWLRWQNTRANVSACRSTSPTRGWMLPLAECSKTSCIAVQLRIRARVVKAILKRLALGKGYRGYFL